MTSPTLELFDVSKSFAGKPAVSNVSLQVRPGEIVGFLGPNGAGKTTTLRMALGLIKPDNGRVEMFGKSPGPQFFGRIGFLPEERGLYKKQTARAAIAHMARLNGMKGREAFAKADELMDRYGLSEVKRLKNKSLSKGMAQKVQFLAAIAHDPEFYILDEPFSGLDPVNQQILEKMVREIANRGRTIIFSTHVMEHAERLCDRIVLMSNAKKVFDGTTESALAKAPTRLVIGSEDSRIHVLMATYASEIQTREDGALETLLKDGADPHVILEACVDQKIKLNRFTPKNPTLHEAFVTLLSRDEIAKMKEVA